MENKKFTYILLAVLVTVVIASVITDKLPRSGPQPGLETEKPKKFSSLSELKTFLKENTESSSFYGGFLGMRTGTSVEMNMAMAPIAGAEKLAAESGGGEAADYSQTNIQVAGVDELDIVKNDGKYIYTSIGNKIVITRAYPAEDMQILSEINLTGVRGLFINENRLIAIKSDYGYRHDSSKTQVYVYDVSDRSEPVLEKNLSGEGNCVASRMIGDYVYIISTKYINIDNPILPIYEVGGVKQEIAVSDINYFNYPDTSYVFTSIMALDIEKGEFNSEIYLTGGTSDIYVSQDNIYLTYTKTINGKAYYTQIIEEVFIPLVLKAEKEKIQEILDSDKKEYEKYNEANRIIKEYSDSLTGKEKADFDKELMEELQDFEFKIQKQYEKTIIHKINIDKLDIEYENVGEAPGRVLNQFSIDEFNGYFRIATTTGSMWGRQTNLNHLYILNKEFEIVGSVEDLAKGERIYSARFLGERAYMVTFRQVDPLYVIDLSNPEDPEVLGYLKVTGYSSYLHPYDENHIIGIGKEATEEGRVQGVKIALFDVSNVEEPVEVGKYEVKQGRWSDSESLYDHKAFLFDKKRNLLVIPISYNGEIIAGYTDAGYPIRKYNYWQGAFVFNIDLQGISLRGKIDHHENETDDEYYYRSWDTVVRRSLYMDDILYTISGIKIKANDIKTLSELNSLDLPYETKYYDYPIMSGSTGIIEDVDI